MKANERRAAAFTKLDLHDDTLVDVRFIPPREHRGDTVLRLALASTWGKGSHVLTFQRCSNLSFRLDCDVLSSNWPFNTSRVSAQTDAFLLEKFAVAQRRLWDVSYQLEDGRDTSPLPKKLRALSRLTLYRIQFFGGRLEVLAGAFAFTKSPPLRAQRARRLRRRNKGMKQTNNEMSS